MTEKTYQMLWDCKYCGQRKNLGLTHRCCPSCGGPQDPTARYFPSDAEKVAVEDHPYAGADLLCPACNTAVSRAAKCCTNCGSPLAGGRDVRLRGDQVGNQFGGESVQDARREFGGAQPQQMQPMQAPPPKKGTNPLFIILPIILVFTILAGGCFFIFRKRAGSFTVASSSWERTVQVERLANVSSSDWCDSVPSDGHVTSRHREQRSTRQIADGQTCTTRRKDMGNGTFKEVQECQPKYKSEPVYADKCDYEAPRWSSVRTAKASGTKSDTPSWPKVELSRPGSCVGCEREGAKKETYTVTFKEPSTGKESSCDFPQGKWQGFSPGARYDGKIGAVTGVIDCDSLVAK